MLIPLALTGCLSGRGPESPLTPASARALHQPALGEADAEKLAREVELRDTILMTFGRNQAVKVARLRWYAALNVEPQATSLPDPTLGFGYQFRSVETRVGAQQWSLGLSQRIPWWEKLLLQGRIAATQTDISQLLYEAQLRETIIDAKDAYYELYYLSRSLLITELVEALLRNQSLLAYQAMESGQTQLREAFRAESQAAQLAYDRILLVEQKAAQEERLRSLLNLPPGTRLGPASELHLYEVADSIEPLYERAEQYAEILQIRGLEALRSSYARRLATLVRVPDISIGLNVISTARSGGALAPADDGKNPIIGLLGMNLPIWEQRNRALIRQNEAQEEAAYRQALDETNEVRAAVAKTFFSARLTRRLIELYETTLVPQAEAVMHQAELDFRSDLLSFSNLIESTLAYHNFLLAYERARADYGQAIGRIEAVLGTTADSRVETPEGPLASELESPHEN